MNDKPGTNIRYNALRIYIITIITISGIHVQAQIVSDTSLVFPGINNISDQSFTLTDTSGKQIPFSDLFGKEKVVVVNFWATWCAPCRKEIPNLIKQWRKYHESGLDIIGLSIEDPVKTNEKVKEYIRKYEIPYPVFYCSKEVYCFLNAANPADPVYVPRLLVYKKDGALVQKFGKWFGQKSIKEQTPAIETALSNQ